MRYNNYLIGILLCLSIHLNGQDSKPNIVLILIDDAGLMDLGSYGGEASTPNIDQLARGGTMFLNHHASPMCAPSRAMLITGYDSHLTGVPNLPLFLPPEYPSKPGYAGMLNTKVKTIAERLKADGYRTYVTGKWHLGHTETSLPSKRGFDRTYILDASGADNYEHKAYLPTQSTPPWFKDGMPIQLPEDYYSSRNLVDEMIGFMEEEEHKSKPFFSFLAFQAIHIPVQAPKKYIEKYETVYKEGWDNIRLQRFANAKQIGIISQGASLGDMHPQLQKWDDQAEEDKKLKSKAMAVNAAMLEAMDFHIGRYIQYLDKNDKLENTVFIVTADNGPEASDPTLVAGMGLWMKAVGYNRDVETLGEKGSWNFIGPEFASASASPSALFKFYAGEGGLRVPLIISGPSIPSGKTIDALSMIADITPTVLGITGTPQVTPDVHFTGRSLLPIIHDSVSVVYEENEAIGMEAAAQKALFK
ncbi:MAG: arylsulfatase A-like enzyme, partial [Saprospiraceae bacterium]